MRKDDAFRPAASQSHASSDYRLGYRGDIEGLRAVAILLVVACHAQLRGFAGGFVGVDVFYVLSGYLITGLLVQEAATGGAIRFANFYGRRLRRLLPAMLLMLLVTCVLGRLLLPAAGQTEQAMAAVSASLWLSNFHFAFAHMNYFAPSAETNLLLHTWSLGVEEQFYLVWPLLIALGMGLWEGASRPRGTAALKYVFVGVFLLSLALSLYWTWHAPRMAFYMVPARAWQFALGALTFLLVGSPAFRSRHRLPAARVMRFAGWLGLAMILAVAWLIDGQVPYPGVWALLPTVGAALVLAAGGDGQVRGVGQVLTVRPLQAIGRVSYSWYLWHWPVLLLGATLVDIRSPWNRLVLVALSLLIAAVSYHFFETPIRRARRLLAKPRMAVFAGIALMIVAGSLALRWQSAALVRIGSPQQLRYETANFDAPAIYGMGCDDWYHSARVKVCAFGDPHASHTAIAIGDSVALQWFPAFRQLFDRPGWRLLVITKSSCPMVNVPIFYSRIGRMYTECTIWRDAAIAEATKREPDVLIMGSSYTYHYTQAQWVDGTRSVLERLAPASKQLYIIRSTPTLPFNGPNCVAPRSWLYRKLAGSRRCTAPAGSPRGREVFAWLKTAAQPFHNVHTIDMTRAICPGGVCRAQLNGRLTFRDEQHLTASFAKSLAPAMGNLLDLSPPDRGRALSATR